MRIAFGEYISVLTPSSPGLDLGYESLESKSGDYIKENKTFIELQPIWLRR